MDNELSTAMHLSVSLSIISIIVGVILVVAGIGQQFQRSSITSVTEVIDSAYGTELAALEEAGEPLPVVTVYSVLEKNTDIIEEIRVKFYDAYGILRERVIAARNYEGILQGDILGGLKGFFAEESRVHVSETAAEQFKVIVDITSGG